MTEPDLLLAVGPVLRVFRELGVRHYVGGSIASSAHGIARASVDADVIAELSAQHVARLVAALRDGYYVPDDRVRDAVERRSSFNVIHLETMLKVDVFVSRDRPFDKRAIDRARPTTTEGAEIPLPLASAEDIVLAKLDWYRRGGEASERQWTDVMGVLRASGPVMDLSYLRSGAHELRVADLLDRALTEAGPGGPR
jgi:hypothetical protein